MIKLSKRLNTIKNMVVKSTSAADIGADHGYLITTLILDEIIKKGYAVENKKGPYNHLCETLKQNHIEDKVITYLGNGILPLKDNVDTLILAGMGTNNIISILNNRLEYLNNIKYIVCDSHTNLYELRSEMLKLGFIIDDEDIVYEKNIFYETIRFIKGQKKYSEHELKYGPCLLTKKSNIFKLKYEQKLNKIDEVLKLNISKEKEKELLALKEELNTILNNY